MAKGKEKEIDERALLEKGEVSLVVEDYNDIFSDFDPRHFSHKALSVDFLDETRRATREIAPGKFGLRFLLPKEKRNAKDEEVIKKRLREHFKKHADLLEKDYKGIIIQGIYFLIAGLVFMFTAAYILFFYHNKINLVKEFLVVLLEPGGWFLFWEGLSLIIFKSKVSKPDLEFYRKMVNSEIIFSHY